MSTRTQHIWDFVETLAGPVVFIGYFGLCYFLSSVGCLLHADPSPLVVVSTGGIGVTLAVLTVAALVGLALIAGAAARRLSPTHAGPDEERMFLAYLTIALSLLAGVGVAWIAAAAATVPMCT